jgi:hypothetical protein
MDDAVGVALVCEGVLDRSPRSAPADRIFLKPREKDGVSDTGTLMGSPAKGLFCSLLTDTGGGAEWGRSSAMGLRGDGSWYADWLAELAGLIHGCSAGPDVIELTVRELMREVVETPLLD